ncbi:hypothetical protein Tco_1458826 [Tanacetum coccineum]
MGNITDIKYVLSQKNLDIFYKNFHIPDEVHPLLPSRNQTIHEMPTGKIGVYTRFFEFSNFRLPLSTFLVDVLSGVVLLFYVNSKNKGWMSFSKRPGHDAVCYTKPLDSLKEMDLLTFIRTADPTKVRIGERQRGDDEPKLLDTTIGRVVLLLPVAPAHGESELEDSVDRLFDEEGNDDQAEQGDSASGGQGKRKSVIINSDEPSHPAKKLRKDHEIPVGTSVSGKSMPAIQRLLAGAVQNVAVRGEPVPSFPFVTSSVSTTPEREDERHTDTLAGANLRTLTAPQRFVISLDSSHHSGHHIAETEVDSLIRSSAPAMTIATTITVTAGAATVVKEAVVKPSLFATGSSFVGGTESIPIGFSDLTDCREMMTLSAEVRMRAEYNIKERRRLKSVVDDQVEVLKVKEEEVKDLRARLLLNGAEAAEAIRLRAKASKFETVEKSLQDEIRSLKERNAALEKEKGELGVRVVDLSTSVKAREQEVVALDVAVTTVKLQNDRLIDQDERMKEVNDKFDKLDVDVIEMALHLEERFYPHLLTTIVGRKWLLTHGMKLAIAKCLHSPEYLSAL